MGNYLPIKNHEIPNSSLSQLEIWKERIIFYSYWTYFSNGYRKMEAILSYQLCILIIFHWNYASTLSLEGFMIIFFRYMSVQTTNLKTLYTVNKNNTGICNCFSIYIYIFTRMQHKNKVFSVQTENFCSLEINTN